jgi:hypothetical protein
MSGGTGAWLSSLRGPASRRAEFARSSLDQGGSPTGSHAKGPIRFTPARAPTGSWSDQARRAPGPKAQEVRLPAVGASPPDGAVAARRHGGPPARPLGREGPHLSGRPLPVLCHRRAMPGPPPDRSARPSRRRFGLRGAPGRAHGQRTGACSPVGTAARAERRSCSTGSTESRLSASEDQRVVAGGRFGGTEVPEPLSPRSRSRVGK